MRATINDASETLRAALHDLAGDAQNLIESMGEEGAEKYRIAIKRLQRNVEKARDSLGDYQESAIRRARRAARAANRLAHDHPWETAAVGAAIGAAIGAVVAILLTRQ